MQRLLSLLTTILVLLAACAQQPSTRPATSDTPQSVYDLLIRNGTIYDGSGGPGFVADIAIRGDRIAAISNPGGKIEGEAAEVIDATGLAVTPGFINMLSWATETLIEDGRSQSDIRQGVTLQVMGEGWSMGPLNPAMKEEALGMQSDIRYEIGWTTLGEYLQYLEDRGISTNVASFVGATTLRIHEIGYDDRPPTADELARMEALVAQAMEEGALGVGSSLIYAPAFYSSTEELIALSRVAARYGGRYISHMRSEGADLLEAVEELITIAREAGIGAEIYHLKTAGKENWNKLEDVFRMVEAARAEGLDITADMYTYTAGATGLDAAMPPWVQEGGHEAWVERLRDPAIRARVVEEIRRPAEGWENLYHAASGADGVILLGFRNDDLKPLTGKTLAEVAALRGTSPEETIVDLVIEDDSRVAAAYFIMSEDNIAKKIRQPWMAFGSDAESLAPEGVFLQSNPHPRAYGTFARLLGKYVREQQVISLPEAIRRLTSFPADNLGLAERGRLQPGHYADIAVFDPATISDHATFTEPHRYATGVHHVLVNGVPVLRDGEHTSAMPGRFVRGPGASQSASTQAASGSSGQ
jgi:N-acyl-D-amino-acid deacylase